MIGYLYYNRLFETDQMFNRCIFITNSVLNHTNTIHITPLCW